MTTGKVVIVTEHPDGRWLGKGLFCKCVDCGTQFNYIYEEENEIVFRVNDYETNRCPWCRPDSGPYKNGRGI